jgi:hypothetical protein
LNLSSFRSKCFFVGGAAGRTEVPKGRNPDHNNYDILFAQNIGIQFYPDDEYFDMAKKLPGPPLKPRLPSAEEETE